MTETPVSQSTVVRIDGSLFITGTRITVYDVMDYLTIPWPPEKIRQWLQLTDHQMTAVLTYIAENRSEVEAEYTLVLQQAEENRRYWESRNKDRPTRPTTGSPPPGQDAAWEKLQEWKARLDQEC